MQDETSMIQEQPPRALEHSREQVSRLQRELDALDAAIAEHYHEHPHHGWTVRPDRGGEALRQLQERREAVRRALVAARHEAGLPVPMAGAMWLINQAPAGYLGERPAESGRPWIRNNARRAQSGQQQDTQPGLNLRQVGATTATRRAARAG